MVLPVMIELSISTSPKRSRVQPSSNFGESETGAAAVLALPAAQFELSWKSVYSPDPQAVDLAAREACQPRKILCCYERVIKRANCGHQTCLIWKARDGPIQEDVTRSITV